MGILLDFRQPGCFVLCHSDHYATLVNERDQVVQQKAEAQRCCQNTMERGQQDNNKVCGDSGERERERERER